MKGRFMQGSKGKTRAAAETSSVGQCNYHYNQQSWFHLHRSTCLVVSFSSSGGCPTELVSATERTTLDIKARNRAMVLR